MPLFVIKSKNLVKYEIYGREMIKTIISDWLKEKQNYICYTAGVDDFFQFEDKLAKMYAHGRVHYSDLEASECYIIENSIDELHSTHNYKHNFKNFNIPRLEYVYDKIKMFDYSKSLSYDWSDKNIYMGIDLLNQLHHSYHSKNKVIEKLQKITYKDIFYNIKEADISQTVNEVFYQSDREKFKTFVGDIAFRSENIQEIGVFFPFKINHDIFEHKHFLFEINPVKFMRKKDNIFTIVENFYKGYVVNTDISEKLFLLEEYFTYPGLQHLKEFAYFDPLKNYKKYEKEYEKISNAKIIKKLGFKNFLFDLFEVLNQAQINVVRFQHKHLINALLVQHSRKGREKSIRDLINSEIKRLEEQQLVWKDYSYQEYYRALVALLESQPTNKPFTANTSVEKMDFFKNISGDTKRYLQLLLNNFSHLLNKSSSSKLEVIYGHYKKRIKKEIVKKYKLCLEDRKVLNEMLLDLIFFYGDRSKEKLSKPFNTTIYKIYKKHQRKNLEDIVNFDFQSEFIQKYSQIFERYRPVVLD